MYRPLYRSQGLGNCEIDALRNTAITMHSGGVPTNHRRGHRECHRQVLVQHLATSFSAPNAAAAQMQYDNEQKSPGMAYALWFFFGGSRRDRCASGDADQVRSSSRDDFHRTVAPALAVVRKCRECGHGSWEFVSDQIGRSW